MHGMQLGINEHLARPGYASNGDSIPCAEREEERRRREEQKVRRTANQGVALWFLSCFVPAKYCLLLGAFQLRLSTLLSSVCHFCLPSACLFPPARRKLYRGERDRSMPTPYNAARGGVQGSIIIDCVYLLCNVEFPSSRSKSEKFVKNLTNNENGLFGN